MPEQPTNPPALPIPSVPHNIPTLLPYEQMPLPRRSFMIGCINSDAVNQKYGANPAQHGEVCRFLFRKKREERYTNPEGFVEQIQWDENLFTRMQNGEFPEASGRFPFE